ncbi:MAG: (d)CMP kinase [Lachnospiraceae bacterium]|nr:(d)CMP kinase [Lachnospiraceae bacterium]
MLNIAIDGPAGAGKSTIAKNVAKSLGIIYVDTGAMYRAMALYMIENNISKDDKEAVENAAAGVNITIGFENKEQAVYLNGENVTGSLRQEAVGNTASSVSVYGKVREKLVDLQREIAKTNDCVMDGRDIGTVVLPDANVKVYLTASVECRAKRRYDELLNKGETPDMELIEKDIRERDHRDMTRENSPLKQADDAVLVDSSDMTIEEVTDSILSLCKKRNG